MDQARNTSRNRNITHAGKTQSIAAWGEELGINPDTLSSRLSRGWTEEAALTVPCKPRTPSSTEETTAVVITEPKVVTLEAKLTLGLDPDGQPTLLLTDTLSQQRIATVWLDHATLSRATMSHESQPCTVQIHADDRIGKKLEMKWVPVDTNE